MGEFSLYIYINIYILMKVPTEMVRMYIYSCLSNEKRESLEVDK